MANMRLDRILSESGRATRSQARDVIRAGRVTVDGRTVLRPEEKADPACAQVLLDGQPVRTGRRYYMLNKPAGVLSATEDRRQSTVLDLLSPADRAQGLFPVGRLDKDTTGLLLLTGDGDWAHRVLSPKSRITKTYLAAVEGVLSPADIEAFAAGMALRNGENCLPAKLRIIAPSLALAELCEGKYHQVRRMFAALGKPVAALKRLSEGALALDLSLAPGRYRELSPEEAGLVFAASRELPDSYYVF